MKHLSLISVVLFTFALTACAGGGSASNSSDSSSLTTGVSSISTVKEEYKEEVQTLKKNFFAGNAEAANYYVNSTSLQQLDLSLYPNGKFTLSIEERIGNTTNQMNFKMYQMPYSLVGILYYTNQTNSVSDAFRVAYGGYGTRDTYFTNNSFSYQYKGVALSVVGDGDFTYNLTLNNGTFTGSGLIENMPASVGNITLGAIQAQQINPNITSIGGYAIHQLNGSSTTYYLYILGPEAEEIAGGVTDASNNLKIAIGGKR